MTEPRKPEFWPKNDLSDIIERMIKHLKNHENEWASLNRAELDLLITHVVCLEEENEVHKINRKKLEANLAASEARAATFLEALEKKGPYILRELEAARAVIEATRQPVYAFQAMQIDHDKKLGKSFEEACENWDNLIQVPIQFGPLMKALEAYDAATKKDL